MRTEFRIGFIGAGAMATTLAVALEDAGYPVSAVASRSISSTRALTSRLSACSAVDCAQDVLGIANLVFLTTPDDVIVDVARSLQWPTGIGLVHCSGALSINALTSTVCGDIQIGAFHPLQSFTQGESNLEFLSGSTVAVEGEEPLLGVLKDMASALGCSWVVIKPEDRVRYHMAAVFASNYLVTLLKMATDLWCSFGMTREEAFSALLPLVRGTLRNIEGNGIPNCLTGPIARGDVATVEAHLAELQSCASHLVAPYHALSLQTVPIALEKGTIQEDTAEHLRRLFHGEELISLTRRGR